MPLLSCSLQLEWTSVDQIVPLGGGTYYGHFWEIAQNMPRISPRTGEWAPRRPGSHFQVLRQLTMPLLSNSMQLEGTSLDQIVVLGGAYIGATCGKLPKIGQEYPPDLVNGHQEGKAATSKCSGIRPCSFFQVLCNWNGPFLTNSGRAGGIRWGHFWETAVNNPQISPRTA